MKKTVFLLIAISSLCFLSSCQRRIPARVMNPSQTMAKKFDFSISPNVREETLMDHYGDVMQTRRGTGGKGGWTGTDGGAVIGAGLLNIFDGIFGADIYQKDERKKHTRTIIENDFSTNIGQPIGKNKLQAIVSLTDFSEGHSINTVPTAIRAGWGTLAGISSYNEAVPDDITGKKKLFMPIFSAVSTFGPGLTIFGLSRWRKQNAKVVIEVTLNDNNGNTVGKYAAVGIGNTATGWYPWNFSKYGAKHYSNIKAVTDAMNKIKLQMEKDHDKIVAQVQ